MSANDDGDPSSSGNYDSSEINDLISSNNATRSIGWI